MKVGLKESKKYAIGSVHENGGGKFEILERFYDKDSDTIMLRYKFLEDGREETNKEANVNASEWKWRKVRGLAGSNKDSHHGSHHGEESECSCISRTEMEEYFEGIQIRVEGLITENKSAVRDFKESIMETHRMLHELLTVVKVQQSQMDTLIKENAIINKLLEKIN